MLEWEPELENLHQSKKRVTGHKSFVFILQRLGVFDVAGGLDVRDNLDGYEMLVLWCLRVLR